jgi:type II secretory pathway component PulK
VTDNRISKRSAVVLIAVLVVVSLLALAAYQYAELMTSEYKAADSLARAAQAKAAAASGVYYTAALLADKDSFTGTLASNPYDNAGMFQRIQLGEGENGRAPAKFSVVAPLSPDESAADASSFRYGVTDESGKINLNVLLRIDPSGKVAHDALMKLPNMTEDVADAIVDWIDPDDEPRANGAESSYYQGLSPSYRCKNGPLDSLEELLLVRGVTPELLFGSDRNRNGAPDQNETDSGNPGDRGWSAYLTVYSRERNVDTDGNPRIYLNDKDTTGLYQKLLEAFSGDATMADFIMAYRMLGAYSGSTSSSSDSSSKSGKSGDDGGSSMQIPVEVKNSPNPITSKDYNLNGKARQSVPSLFALVTAKVAITKQGSITMTQAVTTSGGGSSRGGTTSKTSMSIQVTPTVVTLYPSPLADTAKLKQILPVLFDKCTTRKDAELPARVNVNTASMAVLATLPGLEETDIQMIQSLRPAPGAPEWADPTYQTPAWLLTEANLSPTKLQALERYMTAQTSTYRVQAIGYFEKGGPIARIEAVIDTNAGKPRIVYWRDLSELGKGFNIEK